jgi:hypothetical protein
LVHQTAQRKTAVGLSNNCSCFIKQFIIIEQLQLSRHTAAVVSSNNHKFLFGRTVFRTTAIVPQNNCSCLVEPLHLLRQRTEVALAKNGSSLDKPLQMFHRTSAEVAFNNCSCFIEKYQ